MAEITKEPDKLGSKSEIFKLYEEGKHRRYELLFAVNGGAFTIASLIAEGKAGKFIGQLTMRDVAIGMICFTVAMSFDIWRFGAE